MRRENWFQRQRRHWGTLRKPVPLVESLLLGVLAIGVCLGVWWWVTRGETSEERWISATVLPSPLEAFRAFPSLWNEGALTRNTLTTLKRVSIGFLLAVVVGVPLGILAGCFPRLASLLAPLIMFGRNVPIAALLGLIVVFFGGETLKVMFIFFASVAFIISDALHAVADVAPRYVDTAYTLGANRWQTIMKVLVPLAMPAVFQSCRLLYGLAFGYIMLSEVYIEPGDAYPGLGAKILVYQRLTHKTEIILIVLIIPLVAICVDRFLLTLQRQLFPHVYGGDGMLHDAVRRVLHIWDDAKRAVFGSAPVPPGPSLQRPDAGPSKP